MSKVLDVDVFEFKMGILHKTHDDVACHRRKIKIFSGMSTPR